MSNGLTIVNELPMTSTTLVVALSGWMDGGLVSTGTVRNLMRRRKLTEVARIEPAGFYIDNLPGNMEVAALFRPTVKYKDGLIEAFDMPSNLFNADPAANLLFFKGKEPNLNWPAFSENIFEVARRMNVARIVFVGSFGGAVPHTREPRLYGSVSNPSLLPLLPQFNIRPSTYEGPASFASYLLHHAAENGMEMISIACEIPGYIEGPNPMSIEAVTRRIARMLGVNVDFDKLRERSNDWETKVSEMVQGNKDLAKTIRQLEDQYDKELVEALGE